MISLILAFLLMVPSLGFAGQTLTSNSGALLSCQGSFVRIAPHECSTPSFAGAPSLTITIDNTCRSWNLSASIPTSTIRGYLSVEFLIASANVVNELKTHVLFYADSSCTTLYLDEEFKGYEFVATVAGTSIYDVFVPAIVPVINQTIYYKATTTGGVGSNSILSLMGYYD